MFDEMPSTSMFLNATTSFIISWSFNVSNVNSAAWSIRGYPNAGPVAYYYFLHYMGSDAYKIAADCCILLLHTNCSSLLIDDSLNIENFSETCCDFDLQVSDLVDNPSPALDICWLVQCILFVPIS